VSPAAVGEGEAEDLEELELELLLSAIARRYGYDFRQYSPASLKRRVRRAVREEGLKTLSGLQERLLHDPDALGRFITHLSVHVTGMFRDPHVYQAIREHVVPLLRTWPFVRIWHAGCATGEEVYSLAILLHEEGLLDRCRIYATDLSVELLERARQGVYRLSAMRDYTANYHQAGGREDFSGYYRADHRHALLREDIRQPVVFSQHNLVSDGSFNEFHLILCRNVMIYFDKDLRDRVHRLLHESLVLFGVLGVGVRESMRFTPHSDAYQPLAEEELRLYRRVR
jgi:chemotaxis protein methyltransferase CheR